MRVLQFGKFYPPDIGGIETAICGMTEELNRRGVRCDVLCSNSANEYREETINGYKVYRTKSYGKVASTSISPQMVFKLREIVGRYDVIHVHHPDPMANLALFLVNPKRQKVVVHWHSDIVNHRFLLRLYKPLLLWMLKRADAVVVASPLYVEGSPFLRKFRAKVEIAPYEVERLAHDEEKVKEIKSKFAGKKIVFSLGRFVYYKGFEYLIEAAEYLDDKYVVLLGGAGPEEEKLRPLAEEHKNRVFLLGEISRKDLGSYYKACDVFCLPSVERSEAFGIAMVEAMSFGKPVVATKIPHSGVQWVNRHKVTGLNVEPKNPKALAYAIRQIIENKELYRRMSENALKRYREKFSVEKEIDDSRPAVSSVVSSAV